MTAGEWFQLMAAVGSLGCVSAIIIYAIVKVLNGHIAWVAAGAIVLGAVATGSKLTMSGGADGWKVDLAELKATIEAQQAQIAALKGEAAELRKQAATWGTFDVPTIKQQVAAAVNAEYGGRIATLEKDFNMQGLALAKADEQREELVRNIKQWANAVDVYDPGYVVTDTEKVKAALEAIKATDYKTYWEVDPKAPDGWTFIPSGKDDDFAPQ